MKFNQYSLNNGNLLRGPCIPTNFTLTPSDINYPSYCIYWKSTFFILVNPHI